MHCQNPIMRVKPKFGGTESDSKFNKIVSNFSQRPSLASEARRGRIGRNVEASFGGHNSAIRRKRFRIRNPVRKLNTTTEGPVRMAVNHGRSLRARLQVFQPFARFLQRLWVRAEFSP